MTQPVNPLTQYQQPEKAVSESTKAPEINLHANIQVGTEGWAQQTIKSLGQTHATTLH